MTSKRGDLNFVLGKGKIIDVVTETAINSDFPSEVRAVVTRDVFSESGKVILIPKGTRVFGDFSMTASGGYGRVSIKWKRIDLNSGYSVNISADAIDNLGRTGAQGVVDNKYTEQFANSVLSSAFSIAVAAGIDKIVPPVVPTQGGANATLATNIQTSALAIYNGNSTEDEKVTQICSSIQGMMPDKTSSVYTSFVQACLASMNLQAGQKLSSLMNAVTAASTGLVTSTTIASTPTHKQKAAEDAFKNLTTKMQDIVEQQTFKPTTTIDQGHSIKIFVNKDYLFPKDAVVKSRLLK